VNPSLATPAAGQEHGGELSQAWRVALRTLLMNWRGMATVPSQHLYPHQWSWDSAFISIGLARWHQRRAQSELLTVFSGQWANGMLPHIIFNRSISDESYFPGPSFWQAPPPPRGPAVATSGITQPPVHAAAALEVYRRAADADDALSFLARIYPRLVRQLAYLKAARNIGGTGLLSIVHPWESGLDNSPFWDDPMAGLPADESFPVPRRPDIAVVDPRERPSGREYSRYILLAEKYRRSGYSDRYLRDEHPFVVEDPLFNACYIWSVAAMTEIAGLLGQDPDGYQEDLQTARKTLGSRLWNSRQGVFQALDLRRDQLSAAVTVGGIVPLLDPGLNRDQLSALHRLLLSEHFELQTLRFGVPSNDLRSATFDARLYWRGPSWVNINWLLWKGLRLHGYTEEAELVRAGVVAAVTTSGPYEYFDPFTGAGRGSDAFSWTAALLMDMTASPDPGPAEHRRE
jgi:glycogen debranching enzyme